MKVLSARVVNGHLDLPEGTLEEGATVTLLVSEVEGDDELTSDQRRELAQALAEADRGEGIDGWRFLSELTSR
jgi:hypothetical protein